jgi:hypothetical protein
VPIYEFSSPEGTKYYGEGASPEEAFRTAEEREPNEIAAMRQRQAVRPSGGRQESGAAEAIEDMVIPGKAALGSAMRGDYGQAALDVGMSAAPFIPGPLRRGIVGAVGVGAASAPTATAGGMFDAEPDPVKRRALERQYKEANPRGQRELLSQFNAQQGKVQEEQRALAGSKKAHDDWFGQNEDTIKSLSPEWQSRIRGSGTLPESQAMFDRGMQERQEAKKTVAERYPEMVAGLEGAGMIGSAVVPGMLAAHRTGALSKASTAAEDAFASAYGPGSRASKGRASAADMAHNVLREQSKISRYDPAEIAMGTTVPYTLGTAAPNFYDIMMGALSSDPASQEKVARAWDNIKNPEAVERAMLEGVLFTIGGTWGGGAIRDFGTEKSRAKGVLGAYDSRNAAIKAEEDKRSAANAKRAATVERKRSEPPPPPPRSPVSLITMPSPEELQGGGITEPPPINNKPPRAPRRNPMKRSDLDPLAAGYGDPLA